VVEVDGFAYHAGRAAFERDRARDADLQAAGLRVMRVTWRQLVEEPEAVAARLGAALL
jgi:very-short-patch-repair endonuclease